MTSLRSAAVLSLLCVTPICVAQDRVGPLAEQIVLASEVEWKPLNPARGNRGPQAGTLWGDQTKPGASGFLVKFVDGFSSPPHIHNISYRGVVLGGLLHNDDPDAKPMWMPSGSFWTQPAGESHITASRGMSVAYVEIDEGPYLVQPAEQASDKGERPINVSASNLVWLDVATTAWGRQVKRTSADSEPQIAFLWGKPRKGQSYGVFLKLPKGFAGKVFLEEAHLRFVVIQGQLGYQAEKGSEIRVLGPGSTATMVERTNKLLQATAGSNCVVYVRAEGLFSLAADTPPSD